jgi:hypothetical protein
MPPNSYIRFRFILAAVLFIVEISKFDQVIESNDDVAPPWFAQATAGIYDSLQGLNNSVNELRLASARNFNGSAQFPVHAIEPVPIPNGAAPQLLHNGQPIPFPENIYSLSHVTHATLETIIAAYNLPGLDAADEPAKR